MVMSRERQVLEVQRWSPGDLLVMSEAWRLHPFLLVWDRGLTTLSWE